MSTLEIISLLIGLFTAIILIVQVAIALKSIKADHERRKKQATIEYMQKIRPMWTEARHLLEEKWGQDPINEKILQEILTTHEIKSLIRNMMGNFEQLSVGMNTDVYDRDILFRTSGSFLINIHNRLRYYIENARKNNSGVYSEFSELISDFENRKKIKISNKGNIKYS